MFFQQDDKHVVQAFTDCIAEHGVTQLTVDVVARRLGWSRASLYRQLGSWPQMVRFGYEAMLEWIDGQIPQSGADRRVELEEWWSALMSLFALPAGQAVLGMRALAVLHYGAAEVAELEAARLIAFRRWCAGSPAAFLASWSLVRAAGMQNVGEPARLELREILWLIVGRAEACAELEIACVLGPLT